MSEPLLDRLVRPELVATLLAGLYVALSVIYILTSSHVEKKTA